MNTDLLASIDNVYKQNSIHRFKTIEQCKSDYEKELNVISTLFDINDMEALFLIAIVINNTEYKVCQIEDVANLLEISRFDILKNLNVLFSLQTKNLIEINDYQVSNSETKKYLNRTTYPVEIMNKSFIISKGVENKLLNI
jgi:hypothetical protein